MTEKQTLRLTRHLDAAREEVFRAWTDPDRLAWFFNPEQPLPDPPTVDPVVGGQWRQRMTVDADTDYITGGIYREIVAPERIVFHWGAVDGWPLLDPEHLDAATVVTVELHEEGAGTRLDLTHEFPDDWTPDDIAGCRAGWTQTLDRLVA